jgi:hypoxanthine phosphoribosyltransferase
MDALRPLIPKRAIERRVRAIAAQLSRDYRGRSPLFLGVLKGSYVFLADLTRRMDEPPEIDFIQLSTYGLKGTVASPRVKVRLRPSFDLQGRHVVIVEDIIDSGRTIRFLRRHLARYRPASLRLCALIVRSRVLEEVGDLVDYRGFTVGDGWLVGYGLDCGEKYRTLPEVYVIEGET